MGVPYLIIFAFLMAFLNEAPPPIYSYGFDWTKLKKNTLDSSPLPYRNLKQSYSRVTPTNFVWKLSHFMYLYLILSFRVE